MAMRLRPARKGGLKAAAIWDVAVWLSSAHSNRGRLLTPPLTLRPSGPATTLFSTKFLPGSRKDSEKGLKHCRP